GYTLPAATQTTLGGVIVPTSGNLSVDGSGNISVASTVWTTPGTIGSTTPNTGAFTTLSASGNVTLSGTGTLKLPVGTDAQRGTAAQGMLRFSSTSVRLETYNGTGWDTFVRVAGDTMTGTLSLSSLTCTGGTIDGTAIGSTTAASAKFTTVN